MEKQQQREKMEKMIEKFKEASQLAEYDGGENMHILCGYLKCYVLLVNTKDKKEAFKKRMFTLLNRAWNEKEVFKNESESRRLYKEVEGYGKCAIEMGFLKKEEVVEITKGWC